MSAMIHSMNLAFVGEPQQMSDFSETTSLY
jgi:hypothetical protein